MAKLVAIGESAGPEYVIGELCIIGRSPNAHIQLTDRAISRHHAKITRLEDGFIIEDLDSSQGTVVNGLPVTVSHLRSGDEVRIGANGFRFVDTPLNDVATADFSIAFDDSTPVSSDSIRTDSTSVPLDAASPSDAGMVDSLNLRLQAMMAAARLTCSAEDPRRVLRQVMSICLEIFPAADRALVAVPDRDKRTLVIRALTTRNGVTDRRFHLSRQVLTHVLGTGRPMIAGGPFGTAMDRPLTDATQVELPIMVAPLTMRGERLGLVYVDGLSEAIFTGEDLVALDSLAHLVAQVINTANLNAELLRQSRTEQDLTSARQVQKRFLPRGVPKMPGFSFVAHYDPCRNVGGDLYDFIELDTSRVGIVIGDVSGKGFAAALVMAWVTSQIREAAHQEKSPTAVMARINNALLEARQDELFVTLLYGVLDRWTMRLVFCNAGHMPPLVYRANERQVQVVEDGGGLPVGLVPKATFEEGRLQLGPGDAALFFSDGVTEAMNNDREMYGMERLQRAMSSRPTSAPDMVADVLASVRCFVDGQEQADDITMVGVGVGSTLEDIRTTLPPGIKVGDI